MIRNVPTQRVWQMPRKVPGRVMSCGVGFDGSLLMATPQSTEARHQHNKSGASFPKSRFERETNYLIRRIVDGEVEQEIEVVDEHLVAHFIQPLDEGFLLVGARCRWRPDGPEDNAAVFSWDGTLQQRVCLGDGIQDVRTTPENEIWVSYFDEGIFGNYGWGVPGPEPIGSSGLAIFDREGQPRWRYSAQKAGTDEICDLYAMNVSGSDEAWLYFYTEFPIVQVRGDEYRVWEYGSGGASALAVRPGRVLLYGSYENTNRCVILQLDANGRAREIELLLFVTPDDTPLEISHVMGVRDALYFFCDDGVYRTDVW